MSLLKTQLVWSLAAAVAAFLAPPMLFVLGDAHIVDLFYPSSLYAALLVFPAAWSAIVAWTWHHHGRRSLWLLLEAPFVFVWPCSLLGLFYACAAHGHCL
jgi:hypothetical protein